MKLPLVMIMDADRDSREILEALLRRAGYSVACAADGQSGVTLAKARRPAVIISELYLPVPGNRCAMRAIKRDADIGATPVIVHTTFATRADREWSIASGAEAFLTKPVRSAMLLAEVARLAGVEAKEREKALSGSR